MPEPWARFTAAWFQALAAGEFTPAGDIERLTSRPPTPLAPTRCAAAAEQIAELFRIVVRNSSAISP
jgi:hypothetical protein